MKAAVKILVVLLLRITMTEAAADTQIRFLNNLIKIASNHDPIQSIVAVQHSQDRNCTLQHWNQRGIPIIRSNELTSFEVRRVFSKEVMAVVCLDGHSDHLLLSVVATLLENLRQNKIILWTEKEATSELLADITSQVVRFRFLQIILVAVGHPPSGVLSLHRLHAFPLPRFIKVDNISNFKNLEFPDPDYSYRGMTAIVKIVEKPDVTMPVKTGTGYFPVSRAEDFEILEFARKYNLNFKLYDANENGDHFDIQLSPRFITRRDIFAQTDFVNPSSTTSLMVVVPCSNKRSVAGFLRKLDLQSWFLYLLPVYATFVLVETLVLLVTNRMTGQPYRITNLNALLNLRAFRAILGLPFPELRRPSLSIRQLSLAITIFGFIVSNSFSCKLSAVLTMPLEQPEVTNFKELRDSGLTTIMDEYVHSFIESEMDPQFFNQVIPKFMVLDSFERLKLFVSANSSYSYIVYSKNWQFFQNFGKKAHCTSKDLIIAQNLPRMYVLERNSIFKWFLSRFVMYVQEAGITEHWEKWTPQYIFQSLNVTIQRNIDTGPVPLSLHHLKWLWHLLAIGYGVATVAFLIEICLNKRRAESLL